VEKTMKFSSILLSASMLTAFPALCVVAALWYILIWKESYVNYGMDFLPTIWPLSACLLFAIYKALRGKKLVYIVPLCANLLAILFFVGIDRLNIMLDYDEWASRGMARPFEKLKPPPKTDKVHKPVFTKEKIEEMDKDAIDVYDSRGRLRITIYPRKPSEQEEPDE
jgi:hypothetical protein